MSVLGLKASIATFYAMSFGLYNIGNIRIPAIYMYLMCMYFDSKSTTVLIYAHAHSLNFLATSIPSATVPTRASMA